MEIKQGTLLDKAEVAQLKLGMSKKAVIALLGEPQLTTAFQKTNQLNYTNTEQKNGDIIYEHRLTLIFDNQQTLAHIIDEYYPEEVTKR